MTVNGLYYNGKEEKMKKIRQISIVGTKFTLVDIMRDKPESRFPMDPRLVEQNATLTRRIGFATGDKKFIAQITYVIIANMANMATIIEISSAPNYQSWHLQERIFAYFLKDMEQRGIKHIELEWNKEYGKSKRFYEDIGFTGGEIMLLKIDTRKWRDYLKEYITEIESGKPSQAHGASRFPAEAYRGAEARIRGISSRPK
jgi:hypothetical protein